MAGKKITLTIKKTQISIFWALIKKTKMCVSSKLYLQETHVFVFFLFGLKNLRFVFFLQLVMVLEEFREVNFERRNVSFSVIIWLLSLKNESLASSRTYVTIKTKTKLKIYQRITKNWCKRLFCIFGHFWAFSFTFLMKFHKISFLTLILYSNIIYMISNHI